MESIEIPRFWMFYNRNNGLFIGIRGKKSWGKNYKKTCFWTFLIGESK